MSYLTRLSSLLLLVLALQACGASNPYAGMTAGELYSLAVQEFEQEEYDDAIRALDRLFVGFAGFDEAEDARMLLARAHYINGDYILARSEYNRFLSRYPTSPMAPQAALGACQSLVELSPIPQRDQEYTRQAMDMCRNVAVDYAGTEEAMVAAEFSQEMRLKLAEKVMLNATFYARRDLHDSAIQYYELLLEQYGDTEFAPQALKGIYDANVAIGYQDLADEARDRLLEEYPESPAAQEVRANGPASDGDEVG